MHSGMQLPGRLNGTAFEGRWRLQNTGSTISKTGLTADWYRYSMTVTETTFQIKLLNLRTNVLSLGNVVGIGTVNNADNFRFTILCYGINGSTGAYGTVGVNFSNARITRNGVTLVNIPFSAGAGTQVINVYNGSVYDLGFFTPSAGWAKLSDYYHYNFRKGFTLYTKSGSSDIRISNKIDGTETTYTPPTGYARIANYKGTTTTFNQCESKFKLDDVSAGVQVLKGTFGQAYWGGIMPENVDFFANGTLNGKTVWQSADGDLIRWEDNGGLAWCIRSHLYLPGIQCYSYDDVASPDLCTTWTGRGGTDYVSFELETSEASDLYDADPDRVLFDEDGTAKNIDISGIFSDVVDLTLDRGHLYINSDSDKNLMLYKTDKGVSTPADLKIWKYVEN